VEKQPEPEPEVEEEEVGEDEGETVDLNELDHDELIALAEENDVEIPAKLTKATKKNTAALRDLLENELGAEEMEESGTSEDGEEDLTDDDLDELLSDD